MSVNLPATVWQPTLGNAEYNTGGLAYIVDTTGTFLVDPSGTFIVDTGVTVTPVPATVWTEDDSL